MLTQLNQTSDCNKFYKIIIEMYTNHINQSQNRQQNQYIKESKQDLSSTQILQFMKKRPYTQLINGVQFTYSILCKKQQTFLFGNDRFLYIKGIQSISYARQFVHNQKLPFRHAAEVPLAKCTYTLTEIQHYANDQELLIIQFSGDKKLRWEFVCPSKICAFEWRKKLDQVAQALSEFNQSGFEKYEQFVRNKQILVLQKYNQQQSEINILLGSSRVNSTFINENNVNNLNLNENNSSRGINSNNFANSQYQNSNINISHYLANTVSKLTNSQYPGQKKLQSNQTNLLNQSNLQQSYSAQSEMQQQQNLQPITNFVKNEINSSQVNTESIEYSNSDNAQGQILLKLNQIVIEAQQRDKPGQLSYSPSSIFKKRQKVKHHDLNKHNNDSPISNYQQGNLPNSALFRVQQNQKIDSYMVDNNPEPVFVNRSMMHMSNHEKQKIKSQISKLRRNWIEQLVEGQQIASLIIDFKMYVQMIGQVIVDELYVANNDKMFPIYQQSKEHASYLLEDVYIEVYFYSEEHLIGKNPKYKNAVRQFKNLDYLLGALQNQQILNVPFMMLFQYKGVLGMGKSRIEGSTQFRNRQLYDSIDKIQFQQDTKISAQVLSNQKNCKIICYEKQNNQSQFLNNGSIAYFVQKLTQFLPNEQKNNNDDHFKLFRPQFVQIQEFDDKVFRNQTKEVKSEWISQLIELKINYLVQVLQNEKQYFTNSKQLSDIVHYFGLNMRHIGKVYKKVQQNWLKKIIKDDIIARCLKNYFRMDVQNIFKLNLDNQKKKQRQDERQRKGVINFLNILFGNTQVTFRFWRNLNNLAQQKYNVTIWQNQFTDINVPYLLQAIQNHLKIVLSSEIHKRKPFKDMNTFQPKDFIRFQFDSTIFNLDFTDIFEDIHECLEDQTKESFHSLCQILTKQTKTNITYFQLLKNHPINDKINQFLLQFTSPNDNLDLYSRIQQRKLSSTLIYQSKLAEIKWYLKSGKQDNINKPITFFQEHIRRWLGDVHPLFTRLNRLLAEYFSQLQSYYSNALKYAHNSLDMQKSLFGSDCQQIWKDYFLIGKIHFSNNHPEESFKFLAKGKSLANVQNLADFQVYGDLCLMLAKYYLGVKYLKQSYSTAKQLYKLIRNEKDQRSLIYIIQSVGLIKQLLEINQQYQSYQRFIESDFSQIISAFTNYPLLMSSAIKMIAIPHLKSVLLRKSKNRVSLLGIIDEVSKIKQSSNSCLAYLKAKIAQGVFPNNYLQCLKDIESVIDQIEANRMLQRWKSFNKMTNQAILDKISGSINRGFQFMAIMTALFNLLGPEILGQLSIMEK